MPLPEADTLYNQYVRIAFPDALGAEYERTSRQLELALRTKNLTQMQVDTFTTLQEKLIEIRDEIVSTMSKAPINREIDYIQDRISKELYSDLIFERTDLIFLINRHISRILNPDQQEAIDTEVAKER